MILLATPTQTYELISMRYVALFSSLAMTTFLLATARLVPECYPHDRCQVDAVKMREAIDLIPKLDPFASEWFLGPNAYRTPAVFEASNRAQILVQVLTADGLAVNTETLMTHVWPNARYYALRTFEDCEMSTYGLSGRIEPVIRGNNGPQYQQLEFRLDMTCELRKGPTTTTYTILGIEATRGDWGLGNGNLTD